MKNGGPAFPADTNWGNTGLSVRDWFAGQALTGIIAQASHPQQVAELMKFCGGNGDRLAQISAQAACRYADALIAELEKGAS